MTIQLPIPRHVPSSFTGKPGRRRAFYNYRAFLPYGSEWCSPKVSAVRLKELCDFCAETEIDAVQLLVNILPGTYYMPPSGAEEQKDYAAWIGRCAAPALKEAGISFQLNMVILLGAGANKLDMRDLYPWRFLTDQDGNESLGCANPLCPQFRETMGATLRLWAGTGPEVIWIDDDFRLHNHGSGEMDNELDFYSYDPLFLEKFSERTGRDWTREGLLTAVLQSGRPSPARAQWLDFLGWVMEDTAGWIRREVDDVDSNIRLALMTSVQEVHSIEGRNWERTLVALSGPHRPMTRPCCGLYTATTAPIKTNAISHACIGKSIAVLESRLGRGAVEYGPELENTRFTTWCKSVVNSHFLMILSQLHGCRQITLSINEHEGAPIEDDPTISGILRKVRPRLDALADLELNTWRQEGVVSICDADMARKIELGAQARLQDLGANRTWEPLLLPSGIPLRYASASEAVLKNSVLALDASGAWTLSDHELEMALSHAVLLDGEAAAVLQQRGFGSWIGAVVGERRDYGAMAEKYRPDILPGVDNVRIPLRTFDWRALESTMGAVLSDFIDAKFRHTPGSIIHENDKGGRVAIYASNGVFALGEFGNHRRMLWLHAVLHWLGRNHTPPMPGLPHHGLSMILKNSHERILAISNLGTEDFESVTWRSPAALRNTSAEILEPDGSWCRVSLFRTPDFGSETVLLRINRSVRPLEWCILYLRGDL